MTETLSEHQPDQPNEDEVLIGLLAEASQPDPGVRLAGLHGLSRLPGSLWTAERIAGAMAALAPVAAEETDDEVAFTLWNLLVSLLSRWNEHESTPAEAEFKDLLASLLTASSAEIRGFAATALSGSRSETVSGQLVEALGNEVHWDIATRMISGLRSSDALLDLEDILSLILSPTEEAISFAIHYIGQRALLDGRRPIHRLLNDRSHVAAEAQELGLAREGAFEEIGQWALDRLAAAEFREAIDHMDPELSAMPATVPGVERLGVELFTSKVGAIELVVHLPGTTTAQDIPEAWCEVVVSANEDAHRWITERIAKALATIAGDSTQLQHEGRESRLTIQLGDRPRPTFDRLWQATDLAVAALSSATEGNATNAAAVDLRDLELAALTMAGASAADELPLWVDGADGCVYWQLSVGRRFLDRTARHLALSWSVYLDTSQLATPRSGWLLGVTLGRRVIDDDDSRREFSEGLRRALAWKIGARVDRVEPGSPADPELSHHWDDEGSDAEVFRITIPPSARRPVAEAAGRTIPAIHRELDGFLSSTATLVIQGVNPYEAVGLSGEPIAPELEELDDEPTLEVAAEEILAAHTGPPSEDLVHTVEDYIPFPRPTAPVPRRQDDTTSTMPAPRLSHLEGDADMHIMEIDDHVPTIDEGRDTRDEAATEAAGKESAEDHAQAASNFVKGLSAQLEIVDVYLRQVGQNTDKLAQIMSILLGMERNDATALIERAPCLIAEGVPRDRSRTIKTVLEGTGAKIAVTARET